MRFDELDRRLRVFETAHDHCVLPGLYMVARLDGRGFTRLTRERHAFEAPFDARFRDFMIATTEHLMDCGFRVVYGYTQSDEISLVLHRDDYTFRRKSRKLHSVLAGEASGKFSLLLGDLASFDCRISQLPDLVTLVDYLAWRAEDAHRNALNAHCYWSLRKLGELEAGAAARLQQLAVADRHELLFQTAGVNFNDLPAWQKRGSGLYWENHAREAVDPRTGEAVLAWRRRLRVDLDLPSGPAYREFVEALIEREHQPG